MKAFDRLPKGFDTRLGGPCVFLTDEESQKIFGEKSEEPVDSSDEPENE